MMKNEKRNLHYNRISDVIKNPENKLEMYPSIMKMIDTFVDKFQAYKMGGQLLDKLNSALLK